MRTEIRFDIFGTHKRWLMLFCISIIIWACQKEQPLDIGTDEYEEINGLSRWYTKQLIPTDNPEAFAKMNRPSWDSTKIVQMGDTVMFITPLFGEEKITRELHASYHDGVYSAVVRQYDFGFKDSLSTGTFTLNGRLIDLGFFDKDQRYTLIALAGNRNLVLMGTETINGGTLPGVTVPPPTNPNPPVIWIPPTVPTGPTGPSGPPPGPTFPPPTGGQQSSRIDISGLTAQEKARLEETIKEAKRNCAYRALIKYFETTGAVKIRMSGETNMGIYKPISREIVYNSGMYLVYSELFTHELFHAYQHQNAYGISFRDYSHGKAGNINIEFEQIVFQDISRRVKEGTTGIGEMFKQTGSAVGKDAKDKYIIWIEELTNGGTSYPNLGNRSSFDSEFSQYLSNFKVYGHTDYTGTDIIPSIKPQALKGLFNGSIGTDCDN